MLAPCKGRGEVYNRTPRGTPAGADLPKRRGPASGTTDGGPGPLGPEINPDWRRGKVARTSTLPPGTKGGVPVALSEHQGASVVRRHRLRPGSEPSLARRHLPGTLRRWRSLSRPPPLAPPPTPPPVPAGEPDPAVSPVKRAPETSRSTRGGGDRRA